MFKIREILVSLYVTGHFIWLRVVLTGVSQTVRQVAGSPSAGNVIVSHGGLASSSFSSGALWRCDRDCGL